MTIPAYLNTGDEVMILSTARKISSKELIEAVRILESKNLKVTIGNTIDSADNQMAGSDSLRYDELQEALDNPNIKAIICGRGGYGTVRILDRLSFEKFIKCPKWIVGYSDVTALHSHVNCLTSIPTIHATMPINYSSNTTEALDSLFDALFGKPLTYHLKGHELNRMGSAEGKVVGGNLSVLYSLIGSVSDINTDGCILFLEDLDEYLYHIDRMMHALDRTGKLQKLSGLIVGAMSDMHDNDIPFGNNAYEIVRKIVDKYNYPICMRFPAGHIDNNCALILNKSAKISVVVSGVAVSFE